jgi:DNA-binding CsgD family transcriptional regulator/tetratricopeptide (TPR) repeat protein
MGKLPGPLRLTPTFPFAGRSRELATLRTLLPRVEGEGLRFALVGGEAGSGKSRLVREFAHDAAAAGAFVCYGACDSEVRRPYGPFVEAIGQVVRGADEATLLGTLGPHAGELARLLPDLTSRFGELPPPVAADPDTERHRLHGAVGDLLAAAGRRAPLVVVIEDGHWADTPTLLLLRHLARGASDARALVVTTFRDTEAEVPEALSAALVDLRRSEGVVRLRLGGLSADEISEFVEHSVGDSTPDVQQVAQVIRELTGGNAFLMTELWRTVLESQIASVDGGGARLAHALAELGSPEGVREVVSQRLARLSTATTTLLELAAVAGPEFGLEEIAQSGLDDPERAASLEQAIAHGIIEEVPSPRLAYQFTHELVRRALYDRMPRLRRADLHLRVAEALEQAHAPSDTGDLAELAYHFSAAAPIDGPRRAIEYSILAGREALRTLAFDEAAVRFAAALQFGIDDARERTEAQLDLGNARMRAGGSYDAIEAFRAAAETARGLGDPELLGAAACGVEEACSRPGITDAGAVDLLEEASVALGEDDSELRVRLLTSLGRVYSFMGDYRAGDAAHRAAIAMARRLDDRPGLATVLVASYWSRGDQALEDTLDMLAEARDLAEDLGATDLQTEAMEWGIAGLIALGALEAAERELAEVHAFAVHLRQPFALHVAEHYASTLALCAGRLAEADAAAQRSHEWSRLLTGRAASGVHGIQMFGIRREQGRLAELAPVVRVLAESRGARGVWRAGFAALMAELGMDEDARRELAHVREQGLDAFRPRLWVASLTYLTDACWLVGDDALAGPLYRELAPLGGGNIVIGHGVACYGAADRYLGRLAATLGEHERSTEHFERALTVNRAMGAPTWVAHTMYDYGRALRMRGLDKDAAQASALLSEAAALAERIGMPGLLTRARALGGRVGAAAAPPDDLSWREVDILRLVASGLSNREIGQELSISEHTVANHVRSILRKTGAANRTEAAGYAYRHALLDRADAR